MIALIMAINIGYAVYCSIRDARSRKRREAREAAHAKMVADALLAPPRLSPGKRKSARQSARAAYLERKGFTGGLVKAGDLQGASEAQSDA